MTAEVMITQKMVMTGITIAVMGNWLRERIAMARLLQKPPKQTGACLHF